MCFLGTTKFLRGGTKNLAPECPPVATVLVIKMRFYILILKPVYGSTAQ